MDSNRMIARRTALIGSCAAWFAAPRHWAIQSRAARFGDGGVMTQRDATEGVEGWRVRFEPAGAGDADVVREVLMMAQCQLSAIVRNLPPRAVEGLRKITVRFAEAESELAEPERPGAPAAVVAELGDGRAFLDAARERPWGLLHSLALAYYRARLMNTAWAARIAAPHAAAARSGKYGRVLRADGRRLRHPALNGPADYFAAGTTAFFGTSDHYPFVRPQFREVDAVGYELVARVWREANSARPGGPVLASSLGPPYKVTARSELAS